MMTPRQIDWLLYNLPAIKERVQEIEPRVTGLISLCSGSKGKRNQVEETIIARVTVAVYVMQIEEAIASLTPEQRKIYRMKYRSCMTHRQIAKRLKISEETVGRRVAEIRRVVQMALRASDVFLMKKISTIWGD